MRKLYSFSSILLGLFCLAGCSSQPPLTVSIHNGLSIERIGEMVELALPGQELPMPFVLLDEQGKQVPYQITYDNRMVFPVSVAADETVEYRIIEGTPDSIPLTVCGRQYPERFDDITWENDKAAYRAYGPALQAKGEKAYGYDIFTKSVSEPVVEERYAKELDLASREQIRKWREAGEEEKAAALSESISYHIDHGNGMDCYSVGATLGGGATALLLDSALIYPYCYKEYEILDNGPLRFTVRLTFHPFIFQNDSNVTETRIITLDKGSHLNRTEITYTNLSLSCPVAGGIVIHPQHPDGYVLNKEEGYIAYADSTDRPDRGNGVVYVGAVFASPLENACVRWFDEAEKKLRPGALGHVLGISTYQPETSFLYYWGSGWSKGNIRSFDEWDKYLNVFARKMRSPLQIKIIKGH